MCSLHQTPSSFSFPHCDPSYLNLRTTATYPRIMTLRQVPVELVLDILELLLAQNDKASYRAAAVLAQSCSALRASNAGKRARYFDALAWHSVSSPSSKLPSNIDHEVEVLGTSRWPHEDPVDGPAPGDGTRTQTFGWAVPGPPGIGWVELETLAPLDAHLRGSMIITLDSSGRKLHCFVAKPSKESAALRGYDRPDAYMTSRLSIARPQVTNLEKVIHLGSKATRIAVDEDCTNCVVLYAEPEDQGKEIIEVMSLESGDVLASFYLENPSTYVAAQRITSLEMTGSYFLLKRHSGHAEVRRWRLTSDEPQSNCPVVWLAEQSFASMQLLAPQFLAVTRNDVQLFRLGQQSSQHVATLELPVFPVIPGQPVFPRHDYVRAGGKLTPGQQGSVVIQVKSKIVRLGEQAP